MAAATDIAHRMCQANHGPSALAESLTGVPLACVRPNCTADVAWEGLCDEHAFDAMMDATTGPMCRCDGSGCVDCDKGWVPA